MNTTDIKDTRKKISINKNKCNSIHFSLAQDDKMDWSFLKDLRSKLVSHIKKTQPITTTAEYSIWANEATLFILNYQKRENSFATRLTSVKREKLNLC